MNSKRLAVFAASLQWADAVKGMLRETPRSQTSVTWGIRWSVSAAENDGESAKRWPPKFTLNTLFFRESSIQWVFLKWIPIAGS